MLKVPLEGKCYARELVQHRFDLAVALGKLALFRGGYRGLLALGGESGVSLGRLGSAGFVLLAICGHISIEVEGIRLELLGEGLVRVDCRNELLRHGRFFP